MMDPNQQDKFTLTRHEIGFLIDAIAQKDPAIKLLMQKLSEAPAPMETPVPAAGPAPVDDPHATAGGTASDATIHGPAP